MKKQEQVSSFYFMTILICILTIAFQLFGYYLILNAGSLKVYPNLNLDVSAEDYYKVIYWIISFFTIVMSCWGISASFAAAKSGLGVIDSYISYFFAIVHFVMLIVIIGSGYLSLTDVEGLRDLIIEYLDFLPIK